MRPGRAPQCRGTTGLSLRLQPGNIAGIDRPFLHHLRLDSGVSGFSWRGGLRKRYFRRSNLCLAGRLDIGFAGVYWSRSINTFKTSAIDEPEPSGLLRDANAAPERRPLIHAKIDVNCLAFRQRTHNAAGCVHFCEHRKGIGVYSGVCGCSRQLRALTHRQTGENQDSRSEREQDSLRGCSVRAQWSASLPGRSCSARRQVAASKREMWKMRNAGANRSPKKKQSSALRQVA